MAPVFALLLLAFAGVPAGLRERFRTFAPGARATWLAGAALVALYAVAAFQSEHLILRHLWSASAGLPLELPAGTIAGADGIAVSNWGLALVLGQTAALIVFAFGSRGFTTPVRRAAVCAVGAALAIVSLVPPTLSSPDVYSYAGLAMLGTHAFDPPATAFAGHFAAINRLWGTPILPSPYGPLYLLVASGVTAGATTLAGKLFTLRLLGLASIALLAYAARAAGVPRVAVIALAVNPALYQTYVIDAHNDLLAVAAAVAAFAAVRSKRVALAVGFMCAAALVKVTALLGALFALAEVATMRARVRAAAAAIAITVAGYAIGSGGRYLRAVATVNHAYPVLDPAPERAFHAIVVVTALALVTLAVVLGVRRPTGALVFSNVANFALSWYVVWGLPVAMLDGDVVTVFVLAMPYLVFDTSASYVVTAPLVVVRAFLLAGLTAAAIVSVRRTFARSRSFARRGSPEPPDFRGERATT